MRHRKGFRKLNRAPAHRKLMIAGQVKTLFTHGKIDTTVARAKETQKLAERLVSRAKAGDLHSRRQAFKVLQDKKVVTKLFEEIGPKYQNREGGYTRVLKLPPRLGDGAEQARLSFV
ncbi:MAG TPA: 50S ribosomal protein L17 [Candidatus Fraserbacteria bacterium]|nr:50S ribosomal protein L17 [Candidatus Fraserbacteria bacterium]